MVDNSQHNHHRAIRRWLASRFSPCVAVFSSGQVRETLKKQSSLSPAEVFRPYAEIGNLGNISLQTCERNQPFKLKNFKIDFVDSFKIDGYTSSDQGMLIDFIIQNSTPKKFAEANQSSQPQVQNLLSAQKDFDQLKRQLLSLLDFDKQEQLTPWFSKWKKQFLQTTKFSDHELLQQPIAFIYFISAKEHDPLGTIDILRRGDHLPGLYKEEIYDHSPQNVQHFIFILNPGDTKAFQDAYDIVKQKYPSPNIFEIPMTRDANDPNQLDDVWSKHIDLDEQVILQELHMEQLIRGRSFSQNDRNTIKTTLKKLIEKQILPFIEKKIRNLEVSISNTKKGLKNQLKSLWKKPERGENDGLKDGFKMNKEELEMRNLIDLAFVSQDYETAMNNTKYPYGDFKKCKAWRHAASCQEILTFSQIAFDPTMNTPNAQKEIDQMVENAFMLYHRGNKSQYLIRSALLISELYDCFERYQESANYLLRIANEIKDQSVIVPLFQEQAAYKYLAMKQYRKFALYMILAGKSYEKLNLQNYSFNCFTIVHPFYQRHKGWNDIRFQLYSSLGRNSQNMGDINLAVQFFRNLLQLCCEFDHQQEQKNCLNEFLIAVQNWSSQKTMNLIGFDLQDGQQQQDRKAHIGQLNLPIIIEDSIDIFISSEKLYTNRPDQLINNLYISYPNTSSSILDDNQEYVIQQKAELNSPNCPWKYMAKHLFEHMNDERRKKPELEIAQEQCGFNSEEINEFAIFDVSSRARKRDLTIQKVRKAFVGESIIVKLLMRNPLMADIFINNIRLACRYEGDEEAKSTNFDQLERNIVLRSLETKEIILEIFPKRTGRFIIERIEWILFDVVSCAYQMVKPTDKDMKILTQEELVVPKKLLERENNFIYDIVDQSAELQAKIILEEQTSDNFIFTEFQWATIALDNLSFRYVMKNGYIVCSHPMIFGFSRMRIFDKIEGGEKLRLPIFMRASLMQSNEIKFLLRYEVEPVPSDASQINTAEIDKMSKFRFCRVVFNIDSQYAFSPKRHVHLSTKKANEHIFNVQIVDNLPIGAFYQVPQIQAIEIINRKNMWTLKKKDEKGQFFIIQPNQLDEQPQSLLVYQDHDQIKSILEDEKKKNFFEQELNFVNTKFKMQPTVEEEEVDIVLQWKMPQLSKSGFYCLFKIPLLKAQKQMTEQQHKLQRQRSMKGTGKEEQVLQSARDLIPAINPLHLAYAYDKNVYHDFQNGTKPAIITFSLSISNMIQSSDYVINCKVEALNEWSSLSSPHDVSEGDSFLWIGKTNHIIKHLKTNEIKRIELHCAILKPGVYNLNRFRVLILEEEGQAKHHFIREKQLSDDILITVNDINMNSKNNDLLLNDFNSKANENQVMKDRLLMNDNPLLIL